MGSMWKLYVNTDDCAGLHRRAVDAGHPSLMTPTRLDRWPVTVAFLGDPDGYQVELVQRHEDPAPPTGSGSDTLATATPAKGGP